MRVGRVLGVWGTLVLSMYGFGKRDHDLEDQGYRTKAKKKTTEGTGRIGSRILNMQPENGQPSEGPAVHFG